MMIIRINRFFRNFLLLFLLIGASNTLLNAAKRVQVATEPAFLQQEQDSLIKMRMLEFLHDPSEKRSGEGRLFLAKHFNELKEPQKALLNLDVILRSERIDPEVKFEAQLLFSQILREMKDFDGSLKELNRMIGWAPPREWLIKAKLARADLLGRNLTRPEDLFKAYHRHFSSFPETVANEALTYLMGFERGYDIEIDMQALEAWEEISRFPEREHAELANLHIALLYAYDLSDTRKALPFLDNIASDSSSKAAIGARFVSAALNHMHLKNGDRQLALEKYAAFRKDTDDLLGYKVATLLTGRLLADLLDNYDSAFEIFSELETEPPHLQASATISLERRTEDSEDSKEWAVLGLKMAGYVAEYSMHNPDKARTAYMKALEIHRSRRVKEADPWLEDAMNRTEPKAGSAQLLFEKAYEKYRGMDLKAAVELYERFTREYPDDPLVREALYRMAIITNDDFKDYSGAMELYRRYLIRFVPRKSEWKLDVLYDWGRVDEVKYRMGNLLVLHEKKPVEALKVFEDLAIIHPDSYWAMQGWKDSVRILREDLGDESAANNKMQTFIAKYPESKDAQKFRMELFKRLTAQNDDIEAISILRDYLDHAMPSESDYLALKKRWRDMSFKIQEAEIRRQLKNSGAVDKITLYQNLPGVYSQASTSIPIDSLVEEYKQSDFPEELRWRLIYQSARELYINHPAKAKAVFSQLAETSTGTAKLACILTLGNIAYRVDKSIPDAIRCYEETLQMAGITDPILETPLYRLGRLYLCSGEGIKGSETLQTFLRRFPRSRHVPAAFFALGEAFAAMNHPEQARRFFRRVARIAPKMLDKAHKRLEELENAPDPDEWLIHRAEARKKERDAKANENVASETGTIEAQTIKLPPDMGKTGDASFTFDLDKLSEMELADIYETYLRENAKPRPDASIAVELLKEILGRKISTGPVLEKSLLHYISWRVFREPDAKTFVEEASKLLADRNYPPAFSELLYRLAMVRDRLLSDYVNANKSYFEYLSFFPSGRRALACRERIPQVYELADDKKNALRFYEKLVLESAIPSETRADASIRKAVLEVKNGSKEEAVKTLEAALAFESARNPEILLRLEKLTEDFDYVARALASSGDESFRFKALKRLIGKAEEDGNFENAAQILEEHAGSFVEPESSVWIEKKHEDLGKRGIITELEKKIDLSPEEPETPHRLFRLAKLVEGAKHTKYRAQDLFYEITLVYPRFEFFRESRIRAENSRAIKALEELDTLMKTGMKPDEAAEMLLERARLLKDKLQDLAGARELLEGFSKLFPASPLIGEASLALGDIVLALDKDAGRALEIWEYGLSGCSDYETRLTLTRRINASNNFRQNIASLDYLASMESKDSVSIRSGINEAISEIYRIWRLEKSPELALSLLEEIILQLENRPYLAKLHYTAGLIHETMGRDEKALGMYEKALRSLYHPGCRKDMLFYRMARINARLGRTQAAYDSYHALVMRYPKSLLARSAYYSLYKSDLATGQLISAHDKISKLLNFRSLSPLHKKALLQLEKKLAAQMSIDEMKRLQLQSKLARGSRVFPYYIAKVLENDIGDLDKAITHYEEYLGSHPPLSRSRDILRKIAELYERKGDYIRAIGFLDNLLRTYQPSEENFDLIVKIGDMIADKIINPELEELFYGSIAEDYKNVSAIHRFANAKLRKIIEARELPKKTVGRPSVKREYDDYDNELLEELDEIKEYVIGELSDLQRAEREMLELWDDNVDSPATLDIMKELVDLNENLLMDPEKAAEYYDRWINENPADPLLGEYVMKLFDLYMEKVKSGEKAIALLESFIKENPTSSMSAFAELQLGKANEKLTQNYEEARRIYQRIMDTKRNEPLVHEAYFRTGYVLRDGFADYVGAINIWGELIDLFYNNEFAPDAQFAIAFTYEVYVRDYTKARESYEKILNVYPNSPLQNQVREALLRIGGK